MRSIDADELEELWTGISPGATVHPDSVIDTIKRAKTIKDNNHMHAHWIPCENETGEGSNTYKCSACGEIQMIIDGTPKENGWAYCPHCGEVMYEVDGREKLNQIQS